MAKAFAAADIHTADDLRHLGLDQAYGRLIAAGTRPHFIAYCAVAMGLQDRSLKDLAPDEKDLLRIRFDAIKAAKQKAPSELEEALDALGVKPKA